MVCEMDVVEETVTVTKAEFEMRDDVTTDVTADVTDALDLTSPNKVNSPVTSLFASSQQVGRKNATTNKRSRCGLSLGEEKTYSCEYKICSYKTKYKNAMKRHIETQHLALIHHICPVCHKSFKHQDNLSKHVKIHKKDENCPLCHRVFALKQQLRQHLQNKHGVDPDFYLKNKTGVKTTPVRSQAMQTIYIRFPKEFASHKSLSLQSETDFVCMSPTDEDATFGSEMGMDTEASNLSMTSAPMSPCSTSTTSPRTSNPTSFVSSAISETIVREAVLQNPNLTFKHQIEGNDNIPLDFSSTVEASQSLAPLNLSVSRDQKSLGSSILKVQDHMKAIEPFPCTENASVLKISKCSVCDYQTTNKAHMRRHSLSVHTATKPYSCYVCGQGFTRTEKIKRHFLRVHEGEVYDCQRLKIQATATTVYLSDFSLPPDSREPSPLVTSSSDDIEGHMNEENVAIGEEEEVSNIGFFPEKVFECVHCDYYTNSESHLHTHMNEHGQLRCPHCIFSCTDLETYMYHLKACIKQQRVNTNTSICDYCDDVIINNTDLITHLLLVHGIELFQCEFCSYTTENRDGFLYHYDCHLNGQISATSGAEYDNIGCYSYSCSMCAFQTRYRFVMKNHTGLHTGSARQCYIDGCSFRSVLDMSLKVHMQVCHNSHNSHSSPGFGSESQDQCFTSGQQHTGLMKSPLNSHRCGSCFLTFNSLALLRQHLNFCELGTEQVSL